MRILHTADWHLGAKLGQYDRHAEQVEILKEIIQIADAEAVDMVVVSGDVFDTYHPSNQSEALLYQTLKRLAQGGRRPVLVIAGNHDSADKITVTDTLARSLGIMMVGRPLEQIPELNPDVDEASDIPAISTLRTDAGFLELKLAKYPYPIRVLLTPYASMGRIRVQRTDTDLPSDISQILAQHWQETAAKYCDEQGVNLLMAHQFMTEVGGEQYEEGDGERHIKHIGGLGALTTDTIPSSIQYVALGHLHRYIEVQKTPMPVVYSSSPLCYSFSEAGQSKKVVIVDLEPGQAANLKTIELKAGIPLKRYQAPNVAAAIAWLKENQDCYADLSIEIETSLSSAEVVQIRNAHPRLVGQPVPIYTGHTDTTSNASNTILQALSSQDMSAVFSTYHEKTKGAPPSPELLSLFMEIYHGS